MEKKRKIIIAITATIAVGTLGYFIYRRQTGAKRAIEENTVNPTTGLTPIQEKSIIAQAGPLGAYEGKFIRLKNGSASGRENPCYLIKNGGFQFVSPGRMTLVMTRIYGITDVKDCDDGVKKGLIKNIDKKEFEELKKYSLVPEMTING